MRPLSTVEKPAFRNMLKGYCQNNSYIPDRRTITQSLETWYRKYCEDLKNIITRQKYLCTTTDIWTAHNKSFLGKTIHFINDDLCRVSKILACRRIVGSHDFKNIGQSVHTIHKDFKIDVKKIEYTVTDSASNFLKAYREYKVECDADETMDMELIEQLGNSSNENELNIIDLDLILSAGSELSDSFDIDAELDSVDDEIVLPKHIRCTAHLLNLVATVDGEKAVFGIK